MELLSAKNITIFSIAIIAIAAFGTIINNLYLGTFNLIDFDIVQTKSIYIGFIFTVFIIAHVLYYFSLIDTKEILNNSSFEILYKFVIKLILLSTALFFFLNIAEIQMKIYSCNAFEKILVEMGGLNLFFIGGLFIIRSTAINSNDKSRLFFVVFKIPVILSVSIGLMAFFYYFITFPNFVTIFIYESYFAILFFLYIAPQYAAALDRKNNFQPRIYSLFTKSEFNKNDLFEQLFFILSIIGMFMILLNNYSYKIYPYIDTNYGGGKPKSIIIDYQDKLVKGKLIYQDNTYYYISKDSTILFIDKAKVNKLYLNGKLPSLNSSKKSAVSANPIDSTKLNK
jgi:hypothetical protein